MMVGLLTTKEDGRPSALRSLPMLMMVMTLRGRMVMMVMVQPGKSQKQVQILPVSGFGVDICLHILAQQRGA